MVWGFSRKLRQSDFFLKIPQTSFGILRLRAESGFQAQPYSRGQPPGWRDDPAHNEYPESHRCFIQGTGSPGSQSLIEKRHTAAD